MNKKAVLAGLVCLGLAWSAWGAPADDLRALVEQGKAAEAYALGERHPEALGDPAFDFWYGIAAIDSGHAPKGVLALERHLLTNPENDRARLEVARGYFILGEDARAREEFHAVRAKNPPPAVLATIDRYLDALRAREGRYQTTSRLYVEAGLGWDSNVNAGVGSPNINLPVLGDVEVNQGGVRTGDRFLHLAAGAQITHPVAPGVSIFGAADLIGKLHNDDQAFDQAIASLAGGANWLVGQNLLRGTLFHQTAAVENDRFREVNGVSGDVVHQLSERQALTGTGSFARLNYMGANSPRNAELRALGLGYRHALAANWQPVASAGISFADERNLASRPDLGREIYGLNAQVNLTPGPKWGLNFGYTLNHSRYGAPDPLLGLSREDNFHVLEAAAIYLLNRNISLRAELSANRNDSNLSLFDYKRNVLALKARYEWK